MWFPENERAKATTFGGLASAIGSIVAYLLPTFFVTDHEDIHTDWPEPLKITARE